MKKFIGIILCLLLTVGIMSGCGNTDNAQSEKLSIVTTIFPEYDWVREITGDMADATDLTMLLDSGVDLHSYQPTADDIIRISSCDLFIYVGGESDAWVDDALDRAANKDMKVINLMDVLGDAVKAEEVVEGMEAHDDDDHDDDHDHEDGEVENDEHVWLSLRNAKLACEAICDALCQLDPENSSVYSANTADYVEKLDALDGEYRAAVDGARCNTLLFGDRFPFRYLADDYGLDYYAAFSGCSAESEASFETISFLADKVDELGLNCVITLEGTQHKIAQTVIQSTDTKDQTILTMDSMQSTTSEDVENGATYLSVMEKNLSVLKTALN